MYGKFCNDVCQKQMSTVFARWVHAGFGQEARPSKRHQAPQFAVPVFVVVMDVMRSMLNQKCGKLQEINPERIQHIRLLFWIEYLVAGTSKEKEKKGGGNALISTKETFCILIFECFLVVFKKANNYNFFFQFKTYKTAL